jgi:diacylglycerol kinase family enzyme
LDDGLLDLAGLRHQPGFEPGRLRAKLKDLDNPENELSSYRQLSELTLEFPDGVHFDLDGEATHEARITFSVLPKHLKVAF